MTTESVIRDFSGRIIGYIQEHDNGDKTVRDFYRKILGRYNKATNTTRDFYNRIIARGDQSSMLLNLK